MSCLSIECRLLAIEFVEPQRALMTNCCYVIDCMPNNGCCCRSLHSVRFTREGMSERRSSVCSENNVRVGRC